MLFKKRSLIPALLAVSAMMAGSAYAGPTFEVVSSADIEFQPLNPARGSASPQAGVLWGDIKTNMPSGALIKFSEGFSSPPHIHNVSYRAVVISGAVHNDDPDASKMWMGPGSFWTQPAGETHITAADGSGAATAFLEILQGPYLVRPPEEAFDSGERPINLEARNVVWLDASDITWVDHVEGSAPDHGPKIAFLWGGLQDGQDNGTFLKLPPGFNTLLSGPDSWFRAVVIKGRTRHQLTGESSIRDLTPGSYFGSKGKATHEISCDAEDECLFYVRTRGRYSILEGRP